jgi:hypothetical protein
MSEAAKKRRFFLALLVLSLIAIIAVIYSTPHGAGGIWDSVTYIGTARNLASGSGFYVAAELPRLAFTHWPPLYPLLLSLPAHWGVDPVYSARWINAAAWVCTIVLTGLIAWTYCEQAYFIGFAAASLILFSSDMVQMNAQALSEPVFIALMMASLLSLLRYPRSGLLGTALLMGAALFTRYAGGFLIAGAILALAFARRKSFPWLAASASLAIAVLPTALWTLYNVARTGMPVGQDRHILYHPMGLRHVRDLLNTMSAWFIPTSPSEPLRLILFALLVGLVIGTMVCGYRKRRNDEFAAPLRLAKVSLFFSVLYIAYLFFTMSFVDANTPADRRLLSPIYPLAVLMLAACLCLALKMFGSQSVLFRIVSTVCLLIAMSNAARFVHRVDDFRRNGVGFQTAQWQYPGIFSYVQSLPDNVTLYTDNPELMYFWTGRPSHYLPVKFSTISTLTNPQFDSEMREMGAQQPVVAVLFGSRIGGPLPVPQELIEKWSFHLLFPPEKKACVLGLG